MYMNITLKSGIVGVTLAFMCFQEAQAWNNPARSVAANSNSSKNTMKNRAAACAPATGLNKLEYNNVSALLETGGSMFQDRANGTSAYEIPKGSKKHVIFAGALWMGGKDFNDQLKLAALTFRTVGNDFWTGPLDDTTAETNSDRCVAYDKFYITNRQEVYAFYTQGGDIPASIANWPAFNHEGDPLAPFFDADGDGNYDPSVGDIPWYQFKQTATELPCGNDRRVTLYGDQNFWWVFNDKGNVHTESGGDPIGMEIHAQAFAFNTSDEVNDMTFYNYELINKGTQTLYNTFFAQYIDPDLGCSNDDYVGCDVFRGLGYCYNGDNDDEGCNGEIGYGINPPAIGIDYFEGPYLDDDGFDNPLTSNISDAIDSAGIPYKGLGIGYSDGVTDNERYGMRKFIAYYRGDLAPNPSVSDPATAFDFYNYMTGKWKDGSPLYHGGLGYNTSSEQIECDYMFPGTENGATTDPLNWSTRGTVPADQSWTEISAGNAKSDKRFAQSSGPFTLTPGASNNITVGFVYARATTGSSFESVKKLQLADDKAQALFDNCFAILDGPYAPDVTTQELDKEIILYLSNPSNSNNYKERYVEKDPFIVLPDEAPFNTMTQAEIDSVSSYRFQGYKIYQVANATIASSDLSDPDKARLIAQVDIKDGISRLINFEFDQDLGYSVPTLKVDGEDEGIKHSFSVKTDAFTQATLVNHKTYYFIAVSYAYNNYKSYNPTDPTAQDGQQKPYIESRQSAQGPIQNIAAIPHIPSPENGGTYATANYGDGPIITRIEGKGNGGLYMDMTAETEAEILMNGFDPYPSYYGGEGNGPVEVKVIDPLNVRNSEFELRFLRDADAAVGSTTLGYTTAKWMLTDLNSGEVWYADTSINIGDEFLIPDIGLSLKVAQYDYTITCNGDRYSEPISATITYTDSSQRWLEGIHDADGTSIQNWIRAGTQEDGTAPTTCEDPFLYNDYVCRDDEEKYEALLDGTIAPYFLGARTQTITTDFGTVLCPANAPVDKDMIGSISVSEGDGRNLESIDLVFTSDKSKWTRCVVVETQDNASLAQGGAKKQRKRIAPSVDKNGIPTGSPGCNEAEAQLVSSTGMGWFPGYAIDIETGDRLNIIFGEDSWLTIDNGRDMIWNPTSTLYSDQGDPFWGGKHYVYIFRNQAHDAAIGGADKMPRYDQGNFANGKLSNTATSVDLLAVWRACMYIYMPTLAPNRSLLSTDARIKMRVSKPYERLFTSGGSITDTTLAQNAWFNLYKFSTGEIASHTNETELNDSILSLINIVPNPYYAYSAYETNKLDNRVKIVNLPDECVIKVYNISGSLIRTLTKSTSSITSVDWDLKNSKGVPISGGVYLIHVEVPNVGERVLKWFGALRPTDLQNF